MLSTGNIFCHIINVIFICILTWRILLINYLMCGDWHHDCKPYKSNTTDLNDTETATMQQLRADNLNSWIDGNSSEIFNGYQQLCWHNSPKYIMGYCRQLMDAWWCGKVIIFITGKLNHRPPLCSVPSYTFFYKVKTSLPIFWVVGYSEEKFPQWGCRF